MSNSWEKVRSFLDMMDIQNLRLPFPSSVSSSSSSNYDLHSLSIGASTWQVGERTARQIMSVIQPNGDSENKRKEIIEYLQRLIRDAFGIEVFPFGSVPLKTYLPHGDIDLTAVNHSSTSQDLAAEICTLLKIEEKYNPSFQVKDVICVPAQVRVVKCTVGGICVDISFNQTAGLCALYFLEQVDQFIGRDHLFKRSVILIKAWCYYESRLLGGLHGLISTYALETLVLHVINLFHSSLDCPLAVLYKFLEYYSTFDWNSYCVGINGLVVISSLPDIVVKPPQDCDDLLLTDPFLRSSKEAILSSMGVVGTKNPEFPVKFLNIVDPLREDNNLGRSVCKGNFYRIRSALSYGAKKLGEVLTSPLENIKSGLEKFFKDTLEINGKGRRADVIVPVSAYGSVISAERDSDHLLSGMHYGLWFHDYGMMYPVQAKTSSHKGRNNRWVGMAHNAQFDPNMNYGMSKSLPTYYSVDKIPPSYVSVRKSSPSSGDGLSSNSLNNAASGKEKWKSRGTGTYIPHLGHLIRRNVILEANEEEQEREEEQESEKEQEREENQEREKEQDWEKEVETVDSPACTPREANLSSDEGGYIDVFSFSIEEFPLLPGSKPIPIKDSQSQLVSPEPEQVKEISASMDSLECDSFKLSSPRSLSLSETGKLLENQSDSDVSVNLDLVNDPPTVTKQEDQESPKSEEKLVVPEQPLLLADDNEFPPLSRPARPAEPLIKVTKKEFPPLSACLKTHKKNKWKKGL